jgi:hypothetical protein
MWIQNRDSDPDSNPAPDLKLTSGRIRIQNLTLGRKENYRTVIDSAQVWRKERKRRKEKEEETEKKVIAEVTVCL